MTLRLRRSFFPAGAWRQAWAAAWLLAMVLLASSAFAQSPDLAVGQQAGSMGGDSSSPVEALPAWRLDIDAPDDLVTLLRTYLDLARFQEMKQNDADRINLVELRRLVISAPEQARALLEAEGYFGAHITTGVRDAQGVEPMVVWIKIDPGHRTRIGKVQLLFEGELDSRLADGEPEAKALVDKLYEGWDLPVGKPFRQADWSAAKSATLAKLRAMGYPTATWSGTSVTVDAEQEKASLFLIADSGPAFFYGDIQIEGLKRQPASAVTNLAPFRRGAAYQEAQLVELQERIQKLNLFENVFVATDVDPTSAAAVPVVVQVSELPMQQASAGVGVSSDTGPRISLTHLHRKPLDSHWQAKSKVLVGRDDSTLQLDLISHPWPGNKRGLVSGKLTFQYDDEDTLTSAQRLLVGRLREGSRLERMDAIEFQRATVTKADGLVVSEASSVSYSTEWIFRYLDNQLLPTKGTTSTVSLTAGRSFSTLQLSGNFGRAYWRSTGYLPLPANWYLTARGEVGQVLSTPNASVPDTLLFRAGGDESVRGYAYRSLGVEKDGVTIGGESLATASLEIARPFIKSVPNLWAALFVDAGDASADFKSLQPKLGYGAGLRWRSPIGPIRFDVAYGRQIEEWRLHFSLGVSL